jgi:hypothetical protein
MLFARRNLAGGGGSGYAWQRNDQRIVVRDDVEPDDAEQLPAVMLDENSLAQLIDLFPGDRLGWVAMTRCGEIHGPAPMLNTMASMNTSPFSDRNPSGQRTSRRTRRRAQCPLFRAQLQARSVRQNAREAR